MASLIYYDTNSYATSNLYSVLKAIPNFWDETDDETSSLTKGEITLKIPSSTITVSGYDRSENVITGPSVGLIAATANGLVILTTGSNAKALAIGSDDNGNWAAAYGSTYNTYTITNLIADGVSSTSYSTNTTTASTISTQIIALSAVNGNYTFDDLKRILYTPVLSYMGKLTMPNGEKYVKCGAFALKYTE
ncbi:hypothetical protein RASY3_01700 [Ruminococcus albus SY3]|uniref:Uncharacterized protein n=1 Tax=Ruminococcus albus SY3 TaxID=1341156 RepID=A0A011WVD9_RUMAL|nr:hypothetical protein [Ruminococcus albus]EXM40960.1 hypothetical protein RASY3_01700 [Ruminococcus albus SY3]